MTDFSSNKRRDTYSSHNMASPEYFIVQLLSGQLDQKIKKYFTRAEGEAPRSVLDLGCGSQPLRQRLESLRLNYFSTDVAPIEGVNIDYILNFSQPLSGSAMEDKRFDFVLCSEVLEHIPDWDTFFSNLSQVTAEGSVVILTSPFLYFLHEVPHDYFRGTPHAYEFYARRHSFDVLELERAGDYFDVLGTIQNASSQYMTGSKSLFIRLARRLLNQASGLGRRIRHSRRFRKYFYKETSFYLSTVVVLRRTA